MQLLAFAACILQPNSANSVAHEHFSKVDYCDLIRHASDYDGKAVAVKATYRYGFEWQELYCVGCAAPSKIWLDLLRTLPSRVGGPSRERRATKEP